MQDRRSDAEDECRVFRAPIRARSLEAEPFSGPRRGVERGWVGIGEPLSVSPADLDEAIRATTFQHSEKAGRMLRRFATIPRHALVWTRTAENEFRLGSDLSTWRYEASEENETGICQVRPIVWIDRVFDSGSVPARVILAFDRGGRNFQRIRDDQVEAASRQIWAEHAGDG